MEDILSPIRNAEKIADEEIKKARTSAKEKILNAHSKAHEIVEQGFSDIDKEYEILLQNVDIDSADYIKKIQDDIQTKCQDLIKSAGGKMDTAVQKIFERIIN